MSKQGSHHEDLYKSGKGDGPVSCEHWGIIGFKAAFNGFKLRCAMVRFAFRKITLVSQCRERSGEANTREMGASETPGNIVWHPILRPELGGDSRDGGHRYEIYQEVKSVEINNW